ncbi:hypothetical protein NHP190002_03210 [Helicobacter ailurogastricus]|uniref:hypothetical protein n=1 Tax=Helicobacter ailurogastricus TaxID=1578720 RepID=UPI00244D8882|nr:hypothetical protein [Helicobacter ailurogastricus]GMB89643.1 hypothetical protein NHP190002_03210 [Helicobacter ailurogastricus]
MKMTMHEILLTLIERKYEEIKEKQQTGMFEKIFAFEGKSVAFRDRSGRRL